MRTIYLAILFTFVVCCNGQHFLKRRHGLPPIDSPQARARSPILNSITQRVDHFDPRDTRTWSMRYYGNGQFFKNGGPLFIMIGGEWEIDAGWLMTGLMFDMAAEHNGYQFYTEHRYYGASHPTENHSSENMKYLSADQALADLAYFIEEQKNIIPGAADSKVVVVGGSYAGTLATWARLKYPHLIDAAWSSSGPLRATPDFYEYFEAIGTQINRVDQSCYDTVKDAMTELTFNLQTPEGIANMSTLFNTCDIIDTTEPAISYLLSNFANPWAWAIQYAADSSTIQSECDYFNSFPGNNLEKLIGYIGSFYDGWCISDLDYFIDWYNTEEISEDYTRQWVYQCCSEVGWMQSGTGEQPFAYFNNGFLIEICSQLFGINRDIHNEAVNRTNIFYGSVHPEVTKLVSVHGLLDPWKSIGVQEDINDEAPVIIVSEASHCADLGSISDWDSPDMTAAKIRIMSVISQWIR